MRSMWTQNQDVAALDSAAADGSIVQVWKLYSLPAAVAMLPLSPCGVVVTVTWYEIFISFALLLLTFAAGVRWVVGNCDLSMSELGTCHLIFHFFLMFFVLVWTFGLLLYTRSTFFDHVL